MIRRHFDDPPDDDYTDEVEVDVDGPEEPYDPDAWVDGLTAWERARGY
jgi:hypothetical protein